MNCKQKMSLILSIPFIASRVNDFFVLFKQISIEQDPIVIILIFKNGSKNSFLNFSICMHE